jgi:hypothetical protein
MGIVHEKISSTIVKIWKSKYFKSQSPDFIILVINIISHVLKGKEEAIQKIEPPKNAFNVDQFALNQLKDMGFSEKLAREGLRRYRNNLSLATEWILTFPEISDDEEEKIDEEDD